VSLSKLSVYGRASDPVAGLTAVPLPCPVVVVTEYTKPGCRVSEKLPPLGVMSEACTNQSAGPVEFTFVLHTCTVPVDRPPVTLTVTVCAAVASIVSMIVLQLPPVGALSVT
jgi:hypothetical protein